MAKVKKKVVDYDACQWTGTNLGEVLGVFTGSTIQGPSDEYDGALIIETQHGVKIIRVGDWIVRDPIMRLEGFTNAQYNALHESSGK